MATTHPYISSAGNVTSIIEHLRNSVPKEITTATIKQLGIAPSYEANLIKILRFIKIIDDEGKPIEENTEAFHLSEDERFQAEFSKLIESAYSRLFELYSDNAWTLEKSKLIGFFKETDKTGNKTPERQANVFQALAALCGKIDRPASRTKKSPSSGGSTKPKKVGQKTKPQQDATDVETPEPDPNKLINGLGMSIRIEVNLPSDASKETYDHIFTSIRKNLIDA